MRINNYKVLENELDKIAITEINSRYTPKRKKPDVDSVNDSIEKINAKIVEDHRNGTIGENIPSLFKTYLQIKRKGNLYYSKDELKERDFELYKDKKIRLEALLSASINALTDEGAIAVYYHKAKLFDERFETAEEIEELVKQTQEIVRSAGDLGKSSPKNEDEAISYLKEITPLKMELSGIELRYNDLKSDPWLANICEKLHNEVHKALKNISERSQKASKYLFYQVNSVFQEYKSTKARYCQYGCLSQAERRIAAIL